MNKYPTNLNIIIPLNSQIKWGFKRNIILRASLNIDFLQETRICHHLIAIDHIDQGFLQSHVSDAGHVEAVDVVPPVDLVVFVLTIFDGRDVQGGAIREHKAGWGQPLVSKKSFIKKIC